jgi:Papain family cysteine protease
MESAMSNLKGGLGTPLDETSLLDSSHREKLRAVSVTTVEELLGLIQADPEAVGTFLEGSDLAQLQADGAQVASAAVMAGIEEFTGYQYALGSLPPKEITVEESASVDTFQANFAAAQTPPDVPAGGVSLLDCFGPVRHQGQRPTCVAHACCAVVECRHRRRTGEELDFSEQFSYWDAKQTDGHADTDGTFIRVAMPLTVETGVCAESIWPYTPTPVPGNQGCGPPPADAEGDAGARRAEAWEQIDPRSPESLRAILDGQRPAAISVPVYENWYSNPATNALGLIPMPLPQSRLKGGHAMSAVGYENDPDFPGGGGFILRNSWGPGWAPQSPVAPGYGVIPFQYIASYGWEAFTLRY